MARYVIKYQPKVNYKTKFTLCGRRLQGYIIKLEIFNFKKSFQRKPKCVQPTGLYVKLSSGGESGMKNTTLTCPPAGMNYLRNLSNYQKSEAALAMGLALSCGFVPLEKYTKKKHKNFQFTKSDTALVKRLASPCLMSGLSDLED